MYPVENVYSLRAYKAWRSGASRSGKIDLKGDRESSEDVLNGDFWEVGAWDELRAAVSFLTLMNKRDVLYYRGQRAHYDRCVPVLFRRQWWLAGRQIPLNSANRARYYALLGELREPVLKVAKRFGTPRTYLLEHVPAAAASVLQHYELWPTHFIDLTRSLPTAVSFAVGEGNQKQAYLYVFAMPDLRGSITSDIDQHLTLARLEAICPPDAKRPHHQDAYLASRFPEPAGAAHSGDATWKDWGRKTDLMRRLAAKFLLKFEHGRLPGTPGLERSFLLPAPTDDDFGKELHKSLLPVVARYVEKLS
jgi:FRG domain-containing protein